MEKLQKADINDCLFILYSQGKIEEAIKYLEMFVEVAERTKNDKATSRACSNLGAMFNSLVSDLCMFYLSYIYDIHH